MPNPLITHFAYFHMITAGWLCIYTMSAEQTVWLAVTSLVALMFAGILTRMAERLSAVQMEGHPLILKVFMFCDAVILSMLMFASNFPFALWFTLLLTLAYAAEYGKRAMFGAFMLCAIPWLVLMILENNHRYELIDFEHVIAAICSLVIVGLVAHKTDTRFREFYYDGLTKLPNATYFLRKLSYELSTDPALQKPFAVLLLDIKHFETINEHLGRGFGDQLLIAIAAKLRSFCEQILGKATAGLQQNIWLARYNGDQFLFRLNGCADADKATKMAETIIEELEKPWRLFEHEIKLQVHVGVSLYPTQSHQSGELIEQAAVALENAKLRRTSVNRYAGQKMGSFTERFVMEAGMRMALQHSEFVVHYQPKVNIMTGKVVGIEALIRWNHPELGMIQPNKFIGIAEDNGMIVDIGEWILRVACKQHAHWLRKPIHPIRICVNVSIKQLEQPNFADRLFEILQECELEPRFLELEITESLALKDNLQLQNVLKRMAARDVKLTIDDFGTGYASYKQLSQLSIHAIKIDKSFMRGIHHNPEASAIVLSIIQLAKGLNLGVTAEGVETIEQLQYLRRTYCEEAQGFLYMQPEPANIFEPYLTRGFAHIAKALQ